MRIAVMVLAGALAAPALLSPAVAQTAPPAAAAIAPADANGRRAMGRVEQHITDLHKRMGITPAQQAQWNVFADIMRQNARRMEASYTDRQARAGSMTAVDDLKAYASMERARADDVERLIPAFDSLYQSMSTEQRAAADKTFHEFQRGPRGKNRA